VVFLRLVDLPLDDCDALLETFGLLVNVIFGGLDTVAASIGFMTRHLAEDASSRQQLVENPSLIPAAIEEFLRLNRPASRHAAFGDGPHRCPGAGLARMELRVFLEEWLRRIPDFGTKPGERPRTSSGQVNGMMHLPLVWPAA